MPEGMVEEGHSWGAGQATQPIQLSLLQLLHRFITASGIDIAE